MFKWIKLFRSIYCTLQSVEKGVELEIVKPSQSL
jgi:hypothetical protein